MERRKGVSQQTEDVGKGRGRGARAAKGKGNKGTPPVGNVPQQVKSQTIATAPSKWTGQTAAPSSSGAVSRQSVPQSPRAADPAPQADFGDGTSQVASGQLRPTQSKSAAQEQRCQTRQQSQAQRAIQQKQQQQFLPQAQKGLTKQAQKQKNIEENLEAALREVRLSAGGEKLSGPETRSATLPLVKPGTKGRTILVEANHFQLDLGRYPLVIHYDVAFKPETPKRLLRLALEEFRNKKFRNRNPAFDGRKNLYSVGDLPFVNLIEGEVSVPDDEGTTKTFFITVKKVNEINLNVLKNPRNQFGDIQNALQCVDIVLRSAPVTYCVPVGRSFFTKPPHIVTLGNGMEMYNGFYQTAVRGWKMLLNVDVAHKGFPTDQPVIRAVIDVLDDRRHQITEKLLQNGLNGEQCKNVEKFLKTLKVVYEIPRLPASKRVYRVNGLGQPASRVRFTINGQNMTVQEYFAQFKNYKLRYPDMPTLWVGSKQRQEGDRVLLPMELCTILPNQAVARKLNEEQTSRMIKIAATNTAERKSKIMHARKVADYNTNPIVQEFGFTIGRDFTKVAARVLDPPDLAYGNRAVAKVQTGVWRADRYEFMKPCQIRRWSIVSADRRCPLRESDCNEFVRKIKKIGQSNGINILNPPEYKHITNDSLENIKRFFKGMQGYDLIFVIVPNSGPVYSHVKSAAELTAGCLTQCIKMNTLRRKVNDSTIGNIMLKVNSKLNGINHILHQPPPCLRSEPVIIMGADVTHPSPDAQNIPSVAAVTGSLDAKAVRYKICWRLQGPRVEIIADLQNITQEMLKSFYRANNGSKPKKIIFFRDGVSEGQFEDVRGAEIAAIQRACSALERDYQPKITFLVVQKRHHTRLFPVDMRDSHDRNGNVPAGTCVDQMITNPNMQDFYLVSHASIQGVSKPTKYCTIYDDNDFDNDTIEELVYDLCHVFVRCNRSVSYPAPTYYAHLAAARAKVYIENVNLDLKNLEEEQKKYKTLDKILSETPMFFV